MNRHPFVSVLSVIDIIAVIIGCIFYFINPTVTIICGVITAINSVTQVVWGDQNNFSTEIATIIISLIIASLADLPIFEFICFILCAVDLLMLVVGWIISLVYSRKM